MPTLLFVSGMSRSGTSFLVELLNSHPEIYVSYEFGNFVSLNRYNYWHFLRPKAWHRRYLLKQSRAASRLFMLRYLLYTIPFLSHKISAEDLRRILHWIWPDRRLVGDKFPYYLFHLDEFTGIPDSRIIVIYRDCRDVVASFYARIQGDWKDKAWARNLRSIEAITERWLTAIEEMEKHRSEIFCLAYEDLVTEPEASVRKLAAYLGVDAEDFKLNLIRTSSLGKYKQSLTAEQIARIEAIAGDTLRRLGYEV